MAVVIVALVVIVVFGTALFVHFREDSAQRFYLWFETWRKLIGAVLLGAVAWTFLRSGRPELVLIALLALALVTMFVLVEKPNEDLV